MAKSWVGPGGSGTRIAMERGGAKNEENNPADTNQDRNNITGLCLWYELLYMNIWYGIVDGPDWAWGGGWQVFSIVLFVTVRGVAK